MCRTGITLLIAATLTAGSPGYAEDDVRLDAYGEPLPKRAIARLGPARHLYKVWARVCVTPEGDIRVAGARDKLIRLYTLQGSKPGGVKKLTGHGATIERMAFSPDGRWLASADAYGTVRLWDVDWALVVKVLQGPEQHITALAFAPGGKWLAAGSQQGITVWELPAATRRHPLIRTESPVTALAFSPDGRSLAAGEKGGEVRLWNMTTGKITLSLPWTPRLPQPVDANKLPRLDLFAPPPGKVFDLQSRGVEAVVFSPDGKHLAAAGGTQVRIWEPARERLLHQLRLHSKICMRITGSGFGDGPREAGGVLAMAFMPEGKTLFSLGKLGEVIFTDVETGKELRQFKTPGRSISGAVLSPDGRRLVTHGTAFDIAVYDTRSGQRLVATAGHRSGRILSLAFSPDGKLLASGGEDFAVRMWDVAAAEPLAEVRVVSDSSHVAFCSNGKLLAAREYTDRFRLWRVENGGRTLTDLRPGPMTSRARAMDVSPDGKQLAAIYRHSSDIEFYRLDTGEFDHRVKVERGSYVKCLRFSPDGGRIALRDEYAPRIIDAADGRTLQTMTKAPVKMLVFSPDGRLLAGAGHRVGRRYTVAVWDAATGRMYLELKHSSSTAAFSPDGRVIATAGKDIRLWETATGKLLATFDGDEHQVASLAFSPDGNLLASAGGDSSILLWDVGDIVRDAKPPRRQIDRGRFAPGTTTALWQRKIEHPGRISAVAISPDGKTLATGCEKLIRLFDVGTGKLLRKLAGHECELYALAFSPDGKTLASGSMPYKSEHSVRLWDVASGRNFAKHKGIRGCVRGVAFSPDGKRLATAAYHTIPIWEASSGRLLEQIPYSKKSVKSLAYSPDGRFLLTGTTYRLATLWDLATKEQLYAWSVTENERSGYAVSGVAFSPDSRIAASGASDGTVRLWSTATGKQLRQLEGLQQLEGWGVQIFSLAYSPCGKFIAAGGRDGIVLWEVETGTLLLRLRGGTQAICFSPNGRLLASGNGRLLASGSWAGDVLLWNVDKLVRLGDERP